MRSHIAMIRTGLMAIALTCAVLLTAGYRVLHSKRTPDSHTQLQSGNLVRLKIERSASGLTLRWNPHSFNSRAVRLLISDNGTEWQVPLTVAQMQSGSFVYQPHSDQVSFRFQDENTQQTLASMLVIGNSQIEDPLRAETADAVLPDMQSLESAERDISAEHRKRKGEAARRVAHVNETAVIRGMLVKDTPVYVRVPVDAGGRVSIEETRAAHAPHGLRSKFAHLWPFHHSSKRQ